MRRASVCQVIHALGGRRGLRDRRVVAFYHACRRFARSEIKAIGFAGTVRQLRWALVAAAFSPDPRGPGTT